jgi:hypothetical protein
MCNVHVINYEFDRFKVHIFSKITQIFWSKKIGSRAEYGTIFPDSAMPKFRIHNTASILQGKGPEGQQIIL